MNKIPELSVFFPAYNEEANIASTIQKAMEVIPAVADVFEIIIVDDGSWDNTKERAESFALEDDRIRVVSHKQNKGYGGALKTGFGASRYKYVFFTDGDSQFDIKEIDKFTAACETCDIVAGYRKKRDDPFYRAINGKAYNLLVRIFFGLKVRDIDCAFKIINRTVLDDLNLKSDSQFISAELLIKAKQKGYIIKQIGVSHFPRKEGKPTGNSLKAIVNSFKELFKSWKELR